MEVIPGLVAARVSGWLYCFSPFPPRIYRLGPRQEVCSLPQSREFEDFVARRSPLLAIGNTPMVKLDLPLDLGAAEIHAKAEQLNPGGSIKDRPVLRMLVEAILSGELTRDKTIIDATSGNAGIAYAMIGATLGYRVQLVMPSNASEERKRRLVAHGAEIVFTDRCWATMRR